MSEEVTRRLTYRGGAITAHMIVRRLKEEGVRVDWEPPEERRDLASAAEMVVALLVVHGGTKAIDAVVDEFREWLRERGGDLRIDGDEDD